jgi:vitamin B12 transporter
VRCDAANSAPARLRVLCLLLSLWVLAMATPLVAWAAAKTATPEPTAKAAKAARAARADQLWAKDPGGPADSTDATPTYQLTPIKVSGERITPELKLRELPGQTSWVDLEPFRLEFSNAAQVLDQLPGLHVRSYGSFGHLATASLRGANPSQVTIYLDGIPLTQAGTGVTNLAELPFSGIDHIEVYRGFAPATLPGASMGGAINLVTTRAGPATSGIRQHSPAPSQSLLRMGAASFDTKRLGFTQKLHGQKWDFLLSAELLQSTGDFEFYDDNGTPWNDTDDDVLTPRRNNWIRSEELLARVSAPFRNAQVTFTNQWVRRKQGFAGISNTQKENAQLGTTYNLSNLNVQFPAQAGDKLNLGLRLFYDWRRDTFSELVLHGLQETRDVTQAFGTQLFLDAQIPIVQTLTTLLQVRQETFDPTTQDGPEAQKSRSYVELTLGNRWATSGNRFAVQSTVRLSQENEQLTEVTTSFGPPTPVPPTTRNYVDPHVGVRLRLARGLFAEASYGKHHRAPSFLELFGDGGIVSPSANLTPEEGINRDIGLDWATHFAGLRWQMEAAHFRNHTEQLIVFVPNGQRRFIAENIGSARMEGEEYSWRVRPGGKRPRWQLQGNLTRLRTKDLGVDRSYYAGNLLPGRPVTQFFTRFTLLLGRFDASWQYQHLGLNYLDPANLLPVTHAGQHGVDLTTRIRTVRFKAAVRNMNDNKSVDILNIPVPGRTYSLTTEISF